MLDWLRPEFGIDKPSQKLQDVAHLDADALAAEVKKARGRSKPLSVAEVKRLKAEHVASVVPLQTLAGEAHTLEARVSDLVNAAYGLTPGRNRPDVANRPAAHAGGRYEEMTRLLGTGARAPKNKLNVSRC